MAEQTPVATANIWPFGSTWTVHAKHPITGAWIRVTGIASQFEAVVEGDALCRQLEEEARRRGF